ncbi:uncharacterized protein si:busm1-163l24.3 [Labrus mixtus]|uniref:uncharacterized protein si:busm1-163l24.3 n=1 Tax=Labrus mixtus TaxID=508554 RepID=UPI0029C0604C|nr:uncharacterized protein si:busm1-163l24.3 [Labrus mixtus]XP_060882616.1 uncharacterized protein si:busm1-163l24.3 [Labrus mixtus]XP_060882618.1 uncharacterized protein si:busm1-163l24.3 [Labrus mixtus]XP_060882619.1 uncharacterized protein si:busm1-163l24.3 [Labrus mixtus]
MAERGRTVRVSGLPADIEDGRLKDKLLIYFLRKRNGGGEIESVTIVKALHVCALITFEDIGVAQRVIQHSQHILEVDGKRHKVTVTEHQERLDPDEVILSLSATVNYSQLPGGMIALTSLLTSHPDIQINYHATEERCTLRGAYSKIQAALAQLLSYPGGPQSAGAKDPSQLATSDSCSIQMAHHEPNTQDSEDKSRKPCEKRKQRENVHPVGPSNEHNLSSYRHLTDAGYGREDTVQTEGAALQLPEHPTTPEEDFSLIVDADLFQYLQRNCQRENKKILSQYSVDVVDVTNQGLTTLFLQIATGVGEDGRDQERMSLAKKSILRLYQENETKIRRAQLPKNILSLKGGLEAAMENLSVRLPKLLLNEDEQNIYIVGSSSDVSEAKQFLLLNHREEKEELASVLRYPLDDPGTTSHADVQIPPFTSSATVEPVEDSVDQLLRSEEDERRDEGARRYKLAARFKDSGLAALGNRPTDFSLKGLSSPRKQAHIRPMLGHDVLSEAAGIPVGRAQVQNTGGDILFRSGDAFTITASVRNKTSLDSHLTDTRPKSFTAPLSTAQSSLSESSPRPPAGSGSNLRRTSSFSGMPQQKAQIVEQKSQDDSGQTRARSSSFSNRNGRDKKEVYTAEITVSPAMWQHIKEAYSNRVHDLTSDVQMKDRDSKDSTDLIVTLRGANWSTVSSCQKGLQKLVDSVSVDFTLQELKLSELGIMDRADENLQACCAEVRSQFKKVTIHVLDTSLFLLGPKRLCSQVGSSLREIFSGVLAPNPEQHDLSSASAYNSNQYPFVQMNEDKGASLQGSSKPQVMVESPTCLVDGAVISQERRSDHRSDVQETELMTGSVTKTTVKKDPVIKEKLKLVGTATIEGQSTGNDSSVCRVNDVATKSSSDKDKRERSTDLTRRDGVQQSRTEIHDTPQESRSAVGGPCSCVSGESDKLMKRTKCGATFCSKCLDIEHAQCRVCDEAEQTPRGKMKYSKIYIRVPGHHKDSAIKVTYLIPDGVQGEGHPSPGKPFKGGLFEAFFPDCEETRRLLPRLEKAFRRGLIFTVIDRETGAKVEWDCIPHKTSLQGGKAGSGYPDSSYLTRLSKILTFHGIEEPTTTSLE